MRSCEYYQELISRSLDDALSVEERKELAVHLASCPSCSQMRQLMADVSRMMEEDTEELPAGLHENIMASIRRSEMIKANRPAGAPGRHFAPKKFAIPRPVRNILATAACMAVVIAAALSVNPAGRAEEVIATRNMPEAAADQVPQAAPAAAAETPVPAAPDAAPSPLPVVTAEPENRGTGTDTIVTTPAPMENLYLGTPAPSQAPAQGVIGTPVDKVEPTPVPTREPLVIETPAPTEMPVVTEEPRIKETPAAAEEPIPTEAPAALPEENESEVALSVREEANAAAAGAPQEELPADIQKAPPVHLFSMIPSLSELMTGKAAAADNGAALAAATPEPVPTDAPQPVTMDLMDKELAENLVLLLTGTLDEKGQPPEEAELPEGAWDESYVLELVFDEIPCEVTLRLYGQDVYFSLAEIVIDPAALGGTGEVSALPTPTPAGTQEQNVEAGQPTGGDAGGMEEAPAEDFEPQWLLAKCGSDAFTALLSEITK